MKKESIFLNNLAKIVMIIVLVIVLHALITNQRYLKLEIMRLDHNISVIERNQNSNVKQEPEKITPKLNI